MSKLINTNTAYQIKNKRTEDLLVLDMVDEIFKRRREHIFRMPKPTSPVIACMSGGMDTTINIGVLLEDFKLKVYPFFINRGQTNYKWEKNSVEFFNQYYKERYPDLYNNYIEIELDSPPKAYKDILQKTKDLKDNSRMRNMVAYPARNPIIALTGMEYGYALQSKGIFPKTVFATHMSDDPPYHSALTALRIDNLLMCHISGDYNWQFTSIPIERELGNYYGKVKYIKWAVDHNIPIEKSRSCYKDDPIHCGECYPACINRKKAFKDAGVEDKTKYMK